MVEKATSTTDETKHLIDRGTDIQNFREDRVQSSYQTSTDTDKLCPICTKNFGRDIDFSIFEQHVEEHFTPDIGSYELL